ncbi:hypothetical protein WJX73_002095 [Symbiochloris irregularis]|uniref:Uncharacterized protein n=1 Tax=Symbiochloris irregularis TaxID=706552 RepID=A0AAW1PTP2_9CHLO
MQAQDLTLTQLNDCTWGTDDKDQRDKGGYTSVVWLQAPATSLLRFGDASRAQMMVQATKELQATDNCRVLGFKYQIYAAVGLGHSGPAPHLVVLLEMPNYSGANLNLASPLVITATTTDRGMAVDRVVKLYLLQPLEEAGIPVKWAKQALREISPELCATTMDALVGQPGIFAADATARSWLGDLFSHLAVAWVQKYPDRKSGAGSSAPASSTTTALQQTSGQNGEGSQAELPGPSRTTAEVGMASRPQRKAAVEASERMRAASTRPRRQTQPSMLLLGDGDDLQIAAGRVAQVNALHMSPTATNILQQLGGALERVLPDPIKALKLIVVGGMAISVGLGTPTYSGQLTIIPQHVVPVQQPTSLPHSAANNTITMRAPNLTPAELEGSITHQHAVQDLEELTAASDTGSDSSEKAEDVGELEEAPALQCPLSLIIEYPWVTDGAALAVAAGVTNTSEGFWAVMQQALMLLVVRPWAACSLLFAGVMAISWLLQKICWLVASWGLHHARTCESALEEKALHHLGYQDHLSQQWSCCHMSSVPLTHPVAAPPFPEQVPEEVHLSEKENIAPSPSGSQSSNAPVDEQDSGSQAAEDGGMHAAPPAPLAEQGSGAAAPGNAAEAAQQPAAAPAAETQPAPPPPSALPAAARPPAAIPGPPAVGTQAQHTRLGELLFTVSGLQDPTTAEYSHLTFIVRELMVDWRDSAGLRAATLALCELCEREIPLGLLQQVANEFIVKLLPLLLLTYTGTAGQAPAENRVQANAYAASTLQQLMSPQRHVFTALLARKAKDLMQEYRYSRERPYLRAADLQRFNTAIKTAEQENDSLASQVA